MIARSKWSGVLDEYDASSFLHHFVKDDTEEVKKDDENSNESDSEKEKEKISEDPTNLSNISESFLSR